MYHAVCCGVLGWAFSMLALVGTGQAAESSAAKAFGAREQVLQASLSPDGMSIAIIQPLAEPQATALFVARLDGTDQPKPIFTATGRADRLSRCDWVSNTRLICTIFIVAQQDGRRIGYSRLVALNSDGTRVQELSARATNVAVGYRQNGGAVVDWLVDDASASVLMTRSYIPEESTGTLLANQRRGLALERIDTISLKRDVVEQPRPDAVVYLSDQHGSVRIVGQQRKTSTGFDRGQVDYSYRAAAGGAWSPLATYDEDARTGFAPIAVDRDLNAAYGFEWINGRLAAVRLSLDGSLRREVLAARDDVDVDDFIQIGRRKRIVGVSYATDRRQVFFFDPALRALALSLSKALPGRPMVTFIDSSQDESRLLVWAGSDIDPGRYYILDRKTHGLSELLTVRPDLAAFKLAPVQPVTYKAADGTDIPAYLTLPSDGAMNVPAIVMPHGGPSDRDEWGFDWLAQYFAHCGFAVLQPNFRGSSGYGEAWFEKNGFQSWRTAIGDINDGGRWLKDRGISAPGKLAIVGWSYGGYAALQSSALDPDLFKAIIAIAPVTDLEALREEARFYTSYKRVDAFIGRGAHINEGSPAQNAAKIKAPVLMFHGDQDDNVGISESRLMLSRLKAVDGKAELVVFQGLDHQLDDSKSRADMLEKSKAFLWNALGL